jgi:predicted GIY-YIG superfamily endonuclease
MYVCYLISNGRCTYIGITNDMAHRLRQHNGELVGGARYTSRKAVEGQPWAVAALVTGIESKSDALSFEKHVHMRRRRHPGLKAGIDILQVVLARFKGGHVMNQRKQEPRDASLWELAIFDSSASEICPAE